PTLNHNILIKAPQFWKYLGFFFSLYLDFSFHVTCYTNKALTFLRSARMMGTSTWGLSPNLLTALVYTAIAHSIWSYGYQLWYHHNGFGVKKLVEKCQLIQNVANRWIMGAF
ncbi:hypothetical protein AMATHDRAFT_125113, partial [Amanita thiersii Skay4041]